jgi:hypothetical protein
MFKEIIAIYSKNHNETDKHTLSAKCRADFLKVVINTVLREVTGE